MSLYQITDAPEPYRPTLVAAFDSWIDAGSASTTAAAHLAEGSDVVATFDPDALFDYRARRPTLDIIDGHPTELTWPELAVRRRRVGGRDLLVLAGPEPDYRWREMAAVAAELSDRWKIEQWISIGAIPAAVPHTREVPVLGTEARPGLLRGSIRAGPEGTLRVPSACISVLDLAVAGTGIAAVGYYAQVPHYLSGPYPAAAVELLRCVGRHLDEEASLSSLIDEARQLRVRLDAATAIDETTRAYVERLEAMVDEARLPSGDELIGDIERFLRDRGSEGSQRER